MVKSPSSYRPSQWNIRLSQSGSVSITAAVVTTLNTEPGVNVADSSRLM